MKSIIFFLVISLIKSRFIYTRENNNYQLQIIHTCIDYYHISITSYYTYYVYNEVYIVNKNSLTHSIHVIISKLYVLNTFTCRPTTLSLI